MCTEWATCFRCFIFDPVLELCEELSWIGRVIERLLLQLTYESFRFAFLDNNTKFVLRKIEVRRSVETQDSYEVQIAFTVRAVRFFTFVKPCRNRCRWLRWL